MLSDAFLRTAPEGYHWDGKLKGFGVRVGKNRTTFLVLMGRGIRRSIGVYPATSLSEARSEARRLLAQKTLKLITTGRIRGNSAISDFLADCKTRLRPKTVENYALTLRYLPDGYLQDITQQQIVRAFKPLTPSVREHVTRVGKTFYTWCMREGLTDKNPMALMQAPLGKPRERVLTDEEIAKLYHVPQTDSYSRLVHFLVLYGQRRGESSLLQWEWIDKDTITFPSSVTKNKRAHAIPLLGTFPLSGTAFVFHHPLAGWSKLKKRYDRDNNIYFEYTLHDIRRSVSTKLAQLGTPIHVNERLLNHISGSFSGVAGIYNKFSYMDEMRQALDNWHRFLDKLPPPEA
jgi:integrase